jgi:hypothetical protein
VEAISLPTVPPGTEEVTSLEFLSQNWGYTNYSIDIRRVQVPFRDFSISTFPNVDHAYRYIK